MTETASTLLHCNACGKDYRVKRTATLEGKAVRCRCGQLLAAVARPEASAPAASEQDGLTPATPTPRPAARFVTAIAPQRRVTDALAAREDETQPSRFLDLYLPVGLLVVGSVLGTTLCPRFVAKTVQPLPYILISLGLQTLVFLPVAFLAAVVTARLLDVSFGPLGTVALKLVAVTHGSGALADGTFFAMTVLMGNDWHTPLVGFVPYLIACGLPLALLFGLSVGETALMVGIMYLARFLTVLLLGMTVPHLFG